MTSASPLRYPGGKQVFAPVLSRLISLNGIEGRSYAEPYAGGAGAALAMLYAGYVKKLLLNDADPAVAAMWLSVLNDTDEFVRRIRSVELTVAEWRRQRSIYLDVNNSTKIDLGFATFFLNRVNRSGIIKNAGPIGGLEQLGNWKIDARFNREDLVKRIVRVSTYQSRITFQNSDALEFLREITVPGVFVYLDPPYFHKGKELYLNHYRADDHLSLSAFLRQRLPFKWVMSYDDTPEIHKLYAGFRKIRFTLTYSARTAKVGSELLISNEDIIVPKDWCQSLPPLRSIKAA